MKNEGEDSARSYKKLDSEVVMNLIVRVLVSIADKINGVGGGGDEEDFHDCVVKGKRGMPGNGEEEIEIAGREDGHVEDLRLERNACARMRRLDLEKQEKN